MAEPKRQEKAMDKNFKYIVRVMNTDLDGNKPLYHALTKIRGIKYSFANAICKTAHIERTKKTGYLTEDEVLRVNDVIRAPLKQGIPVWMLNRRKDYETGEDGHVLAADLEYAKMNDIKRMQKVKTYKGVRHMLHLPVRGQKTRSNFRRNKAIGVSKKSKQPAKAK
jgi:small subunit ribosomal protein S13